MTATVPQEDRKVSETGSLGHSRDLWLARSRWHAHCKWVKCQPIHFPWNHFPSRDRSEEPWEGSAPDGWMSLTEVVLEAGRGTNHFASCTFGPSRCLYASPAASFYSVLWSNANGLINPLSQGCFFLWFPLCVFCCGLWLWISLCLNWEKWPLTQFSYCSLKEHNQHLLGTLFRKTRVGFISY